MTHRLRIGDMLVQAGMLTAEKLEQALAHQKELGRRLGEILVEQGFVTENQLTQTLSNQLSVPWVSLYHVDFTRALLNYVPRELAERWCLVPVYVRAVRREGDTLFIAMDDPTNEEAIAAVATVAALPVKPMVAAPSDIRSVIRVYYGDGHAAEPRATTGYAAPKAAVVAAAAPVTVPATVPAAAPVAVTAPATAPAARVSGPTPARGKTRAPKQPRMISITLLDGTSVSLPAPGQRRVVESDEPVEGAEHALTAADLVAALRAKSAGADVSDVLGNATWESMFAALLSVLLKKHLIADWEFVEEWKKHQR